MAYKKHGSLYEISSPNGDNYLIDLSHVFFLRWKDSDSQHEVILRSNQVVMLTNGDHMQLRKDVLDSGLYFEARAENGTQYIILEKAISYLRWRAKSSQQEIMLEGFQYPITISLTDHEALRLKLTKISIGFRNQTSEENVAQVRKSLEGQMIPVNIEIEDSFKVLDKVGEKLEKRRGRPKQIDQESISLIK